MKIFFIASLSILWSTLIFAQQGTIRGTVIEEETGAATLLCDGHHRRHDHGSHYGF